MKKVFFDKSITVPLFARQGDNGNGIFISFFYQTGQEVNDIVDKNFQFLVYKRNTEKPFIKLTIGSGIELPADNILKILQASLPTSPESYFYKLYSDTEKSTWLNGEFILYGNLEKEIFENTKTVIVGDTTIRLNITSNNIFLGGVQSIEVTGGNLDFDKQREIYFINTQKVISDLNVTFANTLNTTRFLYIFEAQADVTITMPDICTSKSAMWNGDTDRSFTVIDDDKYIVEGIWDGTKFRLIIT